MQAQYVRSGPVRMLGVIVGFRPKVDKGLVTARAFGPRAPLAQALSKLASTWSFISK